MVSHNVMPEVTIVVSTYNRPAVLKCAIESVLLQTFQNWQLYIVGDACGEKTAEMISAFNDPRIQYCNLPTRCGEQSGPNSAGIAAANTRYVALLNQDDIWLPNHLEVALAQLRKTNISFYCAGAAITGLTQNRLTKKEEAKFILKTHKNRTFEEMFFSHPDYLEPASAWVFTKDILHKVGPWVPAATLYRTPLEDWLLRLWACGAAYILSDSITIIKCNILKHRYSVERGEKPAMYSQKEAEQRALIGFLQRGEIGELRGIIDKDVNDLQAIAKHPVRYKGSAFYEPYQCLVNREAAQSYLDTGHDAYADFCSRTGIQKGAALSTLLQQRTGERLPVHSNWDEMIRFAKNTFSG